MNWFEAGDWGDVEEKERRVARVLFEPEKKKKSGKENKESR